MAGAWDGYTCARCGQEYIACIHTGTMVVMEPDEASRIRARYALGKAFNQNHDETNYRDSQQE